MMHAGTTIKVSVLPHQQRVIDEHQELQVRVEALELFLPTELFASIEQDEQGRIKAQLSCMRGYLYILGLRIDAFTRQRTRA
jgi:hypothetical protein